MLRTSKRLIRKTGWGQGETPKTGYWWRDPGRSISYLRFKNRIRPLKWVWTLICRLCSGFSCHSLGRSRHLNHSNDLLSVSVQALNMSRCFESQICWALEEHHPLTNTNEASCKSNTAFKLPVKHYTCWIWYCSWLVAWNLNLLPAHLRRISRNQICKRRSPPSCKESLKPLLIFFNDFRSLFDSQCCRQVTAWKRSTKFRIFF